MLQGIKKLCEIHSFKVILKVFVVVETGASADIQTPPPTALQARIFVLERLKSMNIQT